MTALAVGRWERGKTLKVDVSYSEDANMQPVNLPKFCLNKKLSSIFRERLHSSDRPYGMFEDHSLSHLCAD